MPLRLCGKNGDGPIFNIHPAEVLFGAPEYFKGFVDVIFVVLLETNAGFLSPSRRFMKQWNGKLEFAMEVVSLGHVITMLVQAAGFDMRLTSGSSDRC